MISEAIRGAKNWREANAARGHVPRSWHLPLAPCKQRGRGLAAGARPRGAGASPDSGALHTLQRLVYHICLQSSRGRGGC